MFAGGNVQAELRNGDPAGRVAIDLERAISGDMVVRSVDKVVSDGLDWAVQERNVAELEMRGQLENIGKSEQLTPRS